ncbi:MAG: ribonuclease III [Terriglobia bacterium]|jgi:ribonuclease-3|nr:ribonuclease III [Terriglobia bacterium]
MTAPALNALETKLGHSFKNRALLEQALTHSSHARENQGMGPDNEQMEFVGDAVLGLVTSLELFRRFPEHQEGHLSKLKAHLVSTEHLVRAAKRLGIGQYLRLGRGEEKSGGRAKATLLADSLEAILAALYLDAGLPVAEKFILNRILAPEFRRLERHPDEAPSVADYKSRLQEFVHATGRPQPVYALLKEHGPAHRRTFTVEARVQSRTGDVEFSASGRGSTKKRAEQNAAHRVLTHFEAQRQAETQATPA